MQITISARHGHLSDGTQEKIREKVERIRRIFDRLTAIEVTVNLEHEDSPSVEIQVSAEHTKPFVATNSGANVSTALDLVIPKIEQQLRKHKEKLTGHKVTGAKHIEVPSPTEPESDMT